jgi:putative ABC transport system permease protein
MIRAMRHVVATVTAIRFVLSARRDLLLEMLPLHHQVAVLARSNRRFRPSDRLLWLVLRRLWPQWRDALVLVQPATVDRWDRDRFDRRWWRRSRRPGRPRINSQCRELSGRLAEENRLWGAPRIHGELLKLGIVVSERTVSRYLRRRPRKPHRPGVHSSRIISASSHACRMCCHRTRLAMTSSTITAEVRPAILVLLAAVALLLITATANVASLQLARATTRRREMALRAAIGARQRHIVRQLLIENGLVGLCGGIAGLALAAGLQRLVPSLLPAGFPRLDAVAIDLRVLVFAMAVSVVASVVCGVLPAWHTRRVNLVETLSEDGVAPIGGALPSPMARTRGLIMAGQVAIACVLLVGAALLTRSLVSLIRADRGYDPVNVLTARLPLPPGYPAERRGQLLETLVERLRAAPGVTHAAYSTALPFVSSGGFTAFKMRSPRNPDLEVDVQATQRIVSPDYFAAMRLRLVAGRTLSDADTPTTRPVIVVNQTFVRQYLGEHPIGFHIPQRGPRAGGLRFHDDRADWEVVGVVDDMRQDSVDAPRQPEVFASFKQLVPGTIRNFDPILIVRTTADPTTYVSRLRSLVHDQAPALALDSMMTMDDRVMTSLEKPRVYAVVLAWFGAFALLIAGVGLFGVLSFSVAQRTREIGVRSALGARAFDIVALVLRQALWIVGVGVTVGLTVALVGVRLLATFLYGISPHDALTFVAVPIGVVAVAVVACLVPARRAATVDPLTALRAG